MNWCRRFLKKRRQSDRVKLQTAFFLLGCFFLGDCLWRCAGVWQAVKTPEEYILTAPSGIVTEEEISELKKMTGVEAVSRQREFPVTFEVAGKDKTVTTDCLQLFGEYLEKAYGIQNESDAKIFWLNQTAWKELEEAEGAEEAEEAGERRQVVWSAGGEDAGDTDLPEGKEESSKGEDKTADPSGASDSGGYKKQGNAVLAERLPDIKAYGFLAGNTASLSESNMIRVRFSGRDLDGMNEKNLTKKGFTVDNSGDIRQASLELEMQFVRMRHDVWMAVTFFIVVFGILRKN